LIEGKFALNLPTSPRTALAVLLTILSVVANPKPLKSYHTPMVGGVGLPPS
jgi:hypothetical protein